MVAEKNHRHSVNNPLAQFQEAYTLQEILESKEICYPITVCLLQLRDETQHNYYVCFCIGIPYLGIFCFKIIQILMFVCVGLNLA